MRLGRIWHPGYQVEGLVRDTRALTVNIRQPPLGVGGDPGRCPRSGDWGLAMPSFGLLIDGKRDLLRAVCLVLALATASVVAAPAEAAATHVAVKLEMNGQFTGPNSVSGTFTSQVGRIQDSGTYTETFAVDGDTIDAVKIFTGTQGLIVVSIQGFVDFPTRTSATFRGGRWKVLFGTGAYAGMKGGGRPSSTGTADLALGTVLVSHRGKARLPGRADRRR